MEITTAPDTVTTETWQVMRQLPGRASRLWNSQASREDAATEIRKLRAEYNKGFDRPRDIRFGIRHVVRTEVIDMTDWEPGDAQEQEQLKPARRDPVTAAQREAFRRTARRL